MGALFSHFTFIITEEVVEKDEKKRDNCLPEDLLHPLHEEKAFVPIHNGKKKYNS